MLFKTIKSHRLYLLLPLLYCNVAFAQIDVFTCEPEWAALTRALGGDAVNVYSATTAQQDPHHIQARPSLIAKVRRADLLVCTGAELETGWLPLLLRKSGNSNIQQNRPGYFIAADHVTLLEKPISLDRSMGDIHASGNPHIHLDPHRIEKVANALTLKLIEIDPENRAIYKQRLIDFSQEWANAISRWDLETKPLRGKSIIVGHNSWVYLERWLGLKVVATLEPKPGIPPSSTHLSKLLTKLEQDPADMIIYADYQDDKPVRWLSEKTGLPAISLPFSVDDNDDNMIQWFDRLLTQLLSIEE